MLTINLLLFSEEKTEKATPKKRSDSRKKGQVLQSREINSAVTLLAVVVILKIAGSWIWNTIQEAFIYFVTSPYSILQDHIQAYRILFMSLFFIAKAIFIILSVAFLFAFLASRLQVGNLFTTETLKFKLERLNPIEGLKKMFSVRSLVQLVKSLLKLFIVGIVGFLYLKDNMWLVLKTYDFNLFQSAYLMYDLVINLAIRMTAAIFIIAIFDYIYQRYDYEKNLKMSKQEIKEEYKMSEGDPQIKSKIKERQRSAAMRRMMQDIPKADVIITNPTHYAVAIAYDEDRYNAPYVLAKGKNIIAQKIKEKAREYDKIMVENKWLAHQLYEGVEIGGMIPPELYEATAEVLAFVYSVKGA